MISRLLSFLPQAFLTPHYYPGSIPKTRIRGYVLLALLAMSPITFTWMTLQPLWTLVCLANYILLLTSVILHLVEHSTEQDYQVMRKIDLCAVFFSVTCNLLPSAYLNASWFLCIPLFLFVGLSYLYVYWNIKKLTMSIGSITTMVCVYAFMQPSPLIYVSVIAFIGAALLYAFPDNDRYPQKTECDQTTTSHERLMYASHDAVQFLGVIIMLCMMQYNYDILFS